MVGCCTEGFTHPKQNLVDRHNYINNNKWRHGSLNGAHGEYTGTDDHTSAGRPIVPLPPPPLPSLSPTFLRLMSSADDMDLGPLKSRTFKGQFPHMLWESMLIEKLEGGSGFISSKVKNAGTGGKSKLKTTSLEVRKKDISKITTYKDIVAKDEASDQAERNSRARGNEMRFDDKKPKKRGDKSKSLKVNPEDFPKLEPPSKKASPDKKEAKVEPPSKEVSSDKKDENEAVIDTDIEENGVSSDEYASLIKRYIAAAPPNSKHQFFAQEEATMFSYDCFGAPFCGPTVIDLASGITPDPQSYVKMCDDQDPIVALGDEDFLVMYAAKRGFNLAIYQQLIVDGPYTLWRRASNSPEKKEIRICHHVGGAGHWTMLCASLTDDHNLAFPKLRDSERNCINTGWATQVDISEEFRRTNNEDVRRIPHRRDKLLYQDTVRVVKRRWVFNLFGLTIWRCSYEQVCVSVLLSNEAYSEMQAAIGLGHPPEKAMISASRQRSVNTEHVQNDVMSGTIWYLKHMATQLRDDENFKERPVNYSGLVSYEVPGRNAVVAGVDVIMKNQHKGSSSKKKAGGNFIRRYGIEESLTRNPIAVAPVGTLESDEGPLMAGLYPDNSSESLLVAFAGRSMNKEPRENRPSEFIEFSKEFIGDIIDKTDFELEEPDHIEFFAEHYKPKRGEKYVTQCLEDYEEHNLGRGPKDFESNSAFVKFEDSSKLNPTSQEWQVKPRLIMTMSKLMSIRCVTCLLLIHAFNDGPFNQYQVKGLTPQEMAETVSDYCDDFYAVTDYSSFESSIDRHIMEIESFAMIKMAQKAGFTELERALHDYMNRPRQLKTRSGLLQIWTRCSGDFWTSFGNGVVNVCVQAFVYHKKNGSLDGFTMLAEGDDGLMKQSTLDPEMVGQLGFNFSSSLQGCMPGDADFLGSRWADGKRYLNIPKVLSRMFWVKNGCGLKVSKQLYILRCMAASVYHLSPGHPVLTAAVNRIGALTAGVSSFRGARAYLDAWKFPLLVSSFPRYVEVDDAMRLIIAEGAEGFLPISIVEQLELERRIDDDVSIYIGSMFRTDTAFESTVTGLAETDEFVGRSSDVNLLVTELVKSSEDGAITDYII